jgi:hypothetical protein
VPVISTVGTSSRPFSLDMLSSSSFFALSMLFPSHYLHVLCSLFIPHQCHRFKQKKKKENARLGNNEDKNGNAASNTNATHVNPGPRQQSALDIVLAETGAQCRVSIIQRTIKNSQSPRKDLAEPNDKAKSNRNAVNKSTHGHLCRTHTQESFDCLSFLDGLVDFHWCSALARWSLANATPVLGITHC